MICAGQEVCAVILVSEQAAIILKTMKIIQCRDYTQKNIAESTASIIEKNLTCMKSAHILRVESNFFALTILLKIFDSTHHRKRSVNVCGELDSFFFCN